MSKLDDERDDFQNGETRALIILALFFFALIALLIWILY